MTRTLQRVGSLACVLLIGGFGLTACDSGSKPQTSIISKPSVQKYQTVKTLEGLITNDEGPVKTGVVKALTEKGQELSRIELTDGPSYSIQVPAGTVLPIILAYYPSDDAFDDDRMISVVVHADASKFDINTLSTRIAKQAKKLGGYTHKNLVQAAEATGTVPATNKTTAGFRGDPTTQYGGWH
ncbi:MAG: hypothetical protein ACU836_16240 [Gammaproteobacteria bacterium]